MGFARFSGKIYEKCRKNDIYIKKYTEKFAHIKKKQYLCIVKQKEQDMKYSEFMKLAAKQRLKLLRHGGNHDVYICEKTGENVVVPRHQSKEISPGLQIKLLKAVGLK